MKRLWWLPSLSAALWLAFFLALTLSNWRLVLISADGDPCLHWRIGNWMIEHRAVIHTEQFSHTRLGATLVSKEWLSEILFALAGNALGWNGAVLLAAALIATTLWLLHRQLLREGCELLLATGLVLVAAYACSLHWLARPHLTTHLLTVVFAWQLREFDHDRIAAPRLIATLAPLMLLWTNLHGAFLTGFVLIGICAAGSCTDRRKAGTLVTLLVACGVASLVNPNGWKLHAQVIGFLRTPVLATMANEFRSPNFHSDGTLGLTLELLVLGAMLLVVRPRLHPTEILLIGGWGFLALHSVRNVPVFALVITPILAGHLNEFLRGLPDSRWTGLYRGVSRRAGDIDRRADGRILAGIAAVALVLIATKPVIMGGAPIIETEPLTNRFPVAAVRFLKENPKAVSGDMFNDYGWGGYMMLVAPERKVFIDGRNDFYGRALVEKFNEVDELRPGWEAVLNNYGVGWTILPVKHPLNGLLSLRTDWEKVYADDVAVIYGRRRR